MQPAVALRQAPRYNAMTLDVALFSSSKRRRANEDGDGSDEIECAGLRPTASQGASLINHGGRLAGARHMATYIVLGQFTDQGIRNIKETTKRAEAVKALGKKVGASVQAIYWTLGQYDRGDDCRSAKRRVRSHTAARHWSGRQRSHADPPGFHR